jgi:hypothetical protein
MVQLVHRHLPKILESFEKADRSNMSDLKVRMRHVHMQMKSLLLQSCVSMRSSPSPCPKVALDSFFVLPQKCSNDLFKLLLTAATVLKRYVGRHYLIRFITSGPDKDRLIRHVKTMKELMQVNKSLRMQQPIGYG